MTVPAFVGALAPLLLHTAAPGVAVWLDGHGGHYAVVACASAVAVGVHAALARWWRR